MSPENAVPITRGYPKAAKARRYAEQKHGEQRYGGDPYVRHLDETASIVATAAMIDMGDDFAVVDMLALVVKAADRLANVTNCIMTKDKRLEMYQREHEDFRKAVQRGSLAFSIWEPLERRIRTGGL